MQVLTPWQHAVVEVACAPYRVDLPAMCAALAEPSSPQPLSAAAQCSSLRQVNPTPGKSKRYLALQTLLTMLALTQQWQLRGSSALPGARNHAALACMLMR